MWAGYLALVNQAAVANGGRPLGFINPTLYAIGSGSSYATAFHDITSGSNGFSATIGYDLATGWGSPNGSGLLNALLAPPGFSLSAAPASQSVVQGTNGNYTVNVTPSGGFSSNVTLSVSGVPSGASASLSPNPVAGGGSPNLSVNAGSAALGTYTLTINASGGGISHTTSVTLSIIPPPIVVTVTPPETILYSGQTQQFTATVMNTTNTAVTWALNPNTGSISSSGLYTAPSLISSQQAVTVSATSVADTTKTSSATIILIPSTPWYNTFWTNRKVLLINHSKVSGSTNLTNFPMLLSVTDANLESTANGGGVGKSDGSDILFTASDGVTKLNHEIESYNPSTGQLIAWVQIPTLSPTLDTVIYIYYGNASASNQQNATGVWDSNFKGVWHLPNGTSLSASDSTSGGSNGTVSGASAVAGEIDGGASFTGTSQISFHDSNQPSGTSARTLSSWISSTSANNSIYFNYGDGTTNGAMVYLGVYDLGDGFAHEAIVGVGGGNSNLGSHVNVNDGLWHYVVATDDGSNNWKMYVDGVLTNSATPLGVTTNTSVNHTATFGTADNGTQAYTGLMDEMRVSSIARSGDWIKTEYNNQSSPATFVSQGAAQNP
jgi:hypothetical protein